MSRLKWGAAGQRFYENGVDRGVLYVDSNSGVAWSGLISVSESPSGGDATPYYLDGEKYLNLPSAEEFEATLTAFYTPPEFDPCDGISMLQSGLIATQQPRLPFGLSYRTRIGNDLNSELGYKIHLLYNVLATPTNRNYVADDNAVFAWKLTTTPIIIPGARPSAQLVVNSTQVDPTTLSTLEDILYGTDDQIARLPEPLEIITLFGGIVLVDSYSMEEMGDMTVDLVSAYLAAKA